MSAQVGRVWRIAVCCITGGLLVGIAFASPLPRPANAMPLPLADLEFAAGRGDPDAQVELATRFEHAEGVPRDLGRAAALYCDAARRGFAEAQFKLGWMFAYGRGVPRADVTAGALFALAARQGHAGAAKALAFVQPQVDAALPQCFAPLARPFDDVVIAEVAAPPDPVVEAHEATDIERLVYRIAPRYAVDARLALAVIAVESDFNPLALSPKNAGGLMQLIPETAQRFGVRRVFNAVENINGGLAYLRFLLALFKGDVTLALAAYNAGEKAVERYRGIPPYEETRRYVQKVTRLYPHPKHPYVPAAASAPVAAASFGAHE